MPETGVNGRVPGHSGEPLCGLDLVTEPGVPTFLKSWRNTKAMALHDCNHEGRLPIWCGCNQGDLLGFLRRKGPLPEADARWLFQQLVFGLDYCHLKVRSCGSMVPCCIR